MMDLPGSMQFAAQYRGGSDDMADVVRRALFCSAKRLVGINDGIGRVTREL